MFEVGLQWVQAHPQRFDLLKIWVRTPPKVAWLQKMAPKVCRKTHEDLFWRSHQKKVFKWSLWEKLCRQKLHKKFFGQLWGNSGKDPSPPQNFACCYTNDEKAPPIPLPHFRKDREGNAPAMPPFSGVPVHIILHALCLLVVEGYNVSL